ncbi:MAG: peptidoglycan bridge formation glycyltransferase FemA/FemB family protein [Patescibacteria group bacterium]|nr:peptidoglycan bridge formation glycyltransferase FemA/FemB family protein [Patescibacteria group bacterium]
MINKNLHPLQSEEWGLFRGKTGVKVVKTYNLQLTIHPIPHTKYTIGYAPKGPDINKKMLDTLFTIGNKENCIFIQLEPNVEKRGNKKYNFKNLVSSSRPLLTKYTFVLDLTKSEEELLKNMHSKTRYNIKLAEKKGVKIFEDNSDNAFEEYLRLTKETTQRQKFYAHSEKYHRLMWETLKNQKSKIKNQKSDYDKLTAHLLVAKYKSEILVAWILFILGDTLYYPYGASSSKYKEVMASNLMMWETIKFGKKLGLKKFDMWGALGPNPNDKDPFYGFHKFKEGYGARHVEFVGSYDYILNKKLYVIYNILNNLRWIILKLK